MNTPHLVARVEPGLSPGLRCFEFEAHVPRVVFAAGALARLPAEVERLGAHRAVVLSTPGHEHDARRIAEMLGTRSAGVFARAVMHVPMEAARAARDEAKRLGADCAVAFGGGSTTGLGKAIALEYGDACTTSSVSIPIPCAAFGISSGSVLSTLFASKYVTSSLYVAPAVCAELVSVSVRSARSSRT